MALDMTEILGITGNTFQVVTFFLGDDEYGVNILNIQEIIRMTSITRIPGSPEFVEGVTNLRGKVIPVIDLRKRFGMEQIERDKNTRIIVMELSRHVVGAIVDSVSEVLRKPTEDFSPPPPTLHIEGDCVVAVGRMADSNTILIVLDPKRILVQEEITALDGVKPE